MQRLADLPAITPERVLELKREAAELKRTKGLKQSVALAQIAQREGFTSWERLVARAVGRDVHASESTGSGSRPSRAPRARA